MKIVSVASPDRLSISLFLSFMKFCLGRGYSIGDLHSLMQPESIELYVNGMIGKKERVIFGYYARKQNKPDVIPKKLIEVSDLVVWFNLYSTEWVVIKDLEKQAPAYIDRWNKNMQRMLTERG